MLFFVFCSALSFRCGRKPPADILRLIRLLSGALIKRPMSFFLSDVSEEDAELINKQLRNASSYTRDRSSTEKLPDFPGYVPLTVTKVYKGNIRVGQTVNVRLPVRTTSLLVWNVTQIESPQTLVAARYGVSMDGGAWLTSIGFPCPQVLFTKKELENYYLNPLPIFRVLAKAKDRVLNIGQNKPNVADITSLPELIKLFLIIFGILYCLRKLTKVKKLLVERQSSSWGLHCQNERMRHYYKN